MTIAQLRTPIDLVPDGKIEQAPTEFRIFKRGENPSDQDSFVFDDDAAKLVMERFTQRGRDLVIDYEHQSMAKPPIKAPAAGWFRLEVRAGELWAVGIRWTGDARREIAAKQYRYVSPTFNYSTETRRIAEVFNVAVTNNPGMFDMPALVAASSSFGRPINSGEKPMMKLKTISWRRNADETITCSTGHGEITLERVELRNRGIHPDDAGIGPDALDGFEEYVNFCAGLHAEASSGTSTPQRLAQLRAMVPAHVFTSR